MRKLFAAAAAALVAVSSFAGTAGAQTQAPAGVWRNPRNSVHVRIQPCGRALCGTVVWADARAQQKAREAGTPNLVGAQLFRQLQPQGTGTWGGRVFVPDRARTVSGTLRLRGRNAVVSGCIVAGLVCRSQTWTRVS
ncbi:MAG: hypothetical protein QOI38_1126 [Sphingomonadales bacterium]|jgi:uncharacterized protein (DUF2147 family)|nr:hypothetical protein [Sphingomonadales bacterium]